MADLLQQAAAGDRIAGDDLQASIDKLRAMATALDDAVADGMSVADIQAIGRDATRLRDAAGALVGAQIDLLAGEAKVTAEHINAAVDAADEVIKEIADVKARLKKVGALLDFLAAVGTGSGKAIVQAAVTLKQQLA